MTPTQLYGRLLGDGDAPDEVRAAAARYRYGRAGMQIHIAMDEPPRWKGPDGERLARTAIVHVTPGLDGVSRAVNEAERGLLPAEATIVAGQPCAVDPSRAPDGKWIVWIQLQELPAGRVNGDAAGELDVGDGTWTEELREAYADRIVARLGESIENLASATLRRIALSPADLEALNPNLVGGDIYAGSCALDQNLLWRPLAAAPGHGTAVEGLWHVGASTHPGPGLGAGSGYLVAKELTTARAATPPACKASRTLVKLALSQISTVGASFEEDVDAYAAAGFDAIGLWEMKLPEDDAANRALLARHGLAVANCVPTIPSFLPLAIPGMEGPDDPETRIDAICVSIRRLAAYEPECVLCFSGPLGRRVHSMRRARSSSMGCEERRPPPATRACDSGSSRSIRRSTTRPGSSARWRMRSHSSTRRVSTTSGSWPTRTTSLPRRRRPSRRSRIVSRASTSPTSVSTRRPVSASFPAKASGRQAEIVAAVARRRVGRNARRRDLLDARRLLAAPGARGGPQGVRRSEPPGRAERQL